MTFAKHLAIALLAALSLSGGAIAYAQTSTTTDTSVMQTTNATSSTTPGTPNTGSGGDNTANWIILAATGVVVLGGVAYLVARPRTESDY